MINQSVYCIQPHGFSTQLITCLASVAKTKVSCRQNFVYETCFKQSIKSLLTSYTRSQTFQFGNNSYVAAHWEYSNNAQAGARASYQSWQTRLPIPGYLPSKASQYSSSTPFSFSQMDRSITPFPFKEDSCSTASDILGASLLTFRFLVVTLFPFVRSLSLAF